MSPSPIAVAEVPLEGEPSPPQEGPSPPIVKGEKCVCVFAAFLPTPSCLGQCSAVSFKHHLVAMPTVNRTTWLARGTV